LGAVEGGFAASATAKPPLTAVGITDPDVFASAPPRATGDELGFTEPALIPVDDEATICGAGAKEPDATRGTAAGGALDASPT
jgi:hypothetical protein